MMREIKFLLIILGAACLELCGAQNPPKIDSLLNVLKRAEEDVAKVNTLNALGIELMYIDPDTTILLANHALSISEKISSKKHVAYTYTVIAGANYVKGNYPSYLENHLRALSIREEIDDKLGMANSLITIGLIYWNQGDYPKALDYYFKALKIHEELKDKNGIATILGNIGLVYNEQGNYSKALDNHFRALKMHEELGSKDGTARHLGNIGNVYSDQGDYPQALEYYFKALKIVEGLGDKNGIAIWLANIGAVYFEQKDYHKTLDYYFKALQIDEELRDKNGIAIELGNIGNVYSDQGDYLQALEYYFKALKVNEEMGNKNEIAMNLTNIGTVYSNQGDYYKALDYYFKAMKIAEQLENKKLIGMHLNNIGHVYTKTGNFAAAEKYLKKAIAIVDSIGALDDLRVIEKSLSQLYDTTGRYKLALEHYKKAIVLKDTLFNQENNKEITRKEMNYEFEKTQAAEKAEHEKQLAVAEVEINKQKVLKYSSIGGLALTLLLFFFSYRFYRARQVLRLQSIRNRIADDLHDDIGSTLNSISVYSEVAKQKSPAVVQELEQIGQASRKIIDAMSDIVWTINTKNDSFEQIILRLRSLTYNLLRAKNIEHTFRVDESMNNMKLSMEHRRNFYLIFKEALNNLVKYSNASRVSISLMHANNFITLSIRDNGIGFDVKQASTGNGLLSMRSRAVEMNAELKIESELGSGTNMELKLKS